MLNWLSNPRSSEASVDVDATGLFEPPETPAPVFAVRAFRTAIFGTPQTQNKARRHSTNDNNRPRQVDVRTKRPAPSLRTGSDTNVLKELNSADVEPPISPTKGILMTPGTAAARRKTVSFGDGVVDNEPKQPSRTGLPDDYPGKFPSPWVKSSLEPSDDDEPLERSQGRKLIEAFEQVREGSSKRASKQPKLSKGNTDVEVTSELTNPQSESGQYWKQEYDIYRERTTREVRKLVLKQKAAKSFARDKDVQCTELAEQLRHERRTVERLEERNAELEAQLREYKERLPIGQASASRHNELRPAEIQPLFSRSYDDEQTYAREPSRTSFLPQTYASDINNPIISLPTRSRPRPMSSQQSQSWTAPTSTFERPPNPAASHPNGRAVTSGTEIAPLPIIGPLVPHHAILPQTSTLDLRIPEPHAPVARQDSAFPSPELPSSHLSGNNKPPGAVMAGAGETSQGFNTKENVAPMGRVHGPRDEMPAGSAAAGRRMIGKSGQVVGADRLAAAKARLQARGRNVS